MVDGNTITQCQQKNQQAFKTLYEACLPYVLAIVKDYTDNPDFRKDLLQEIFAQVFLHIRQYDPGKGGFKPWLRQIAVNRCRMFLRDEKKHFLFEDLDQAAPVQNHQDRMDLPEIGPDRTAQLLRNMPAGYRQVFSLVVLEGYSHDEAGRRLGISAETSRSQLARSKQWLRQQYQLINP